MENEFNPEVALRDDERAELSVVISHPGFKVIQKIFKSCVDAFTINLINTPTDEDKSVLSKHRDCKVAAQLYTLLVSRINAEAQTYADSKTSHRPLDIAKDLDIGEYIHGEEEAPADGY